MVVYNHGEVGTSLWLYITTVKLELVCGFIYNHCEDVTNVYLLYVVNI